VRRRSDELTLPWRDPPGQGEEKRPPLHLTTIRFGSTISNMRGEFVHHGHQLRKPHQIAGGCLDRNDRFQQSMIIEAKFDKHFGPNFS
jgi:hypothetical protein